MLLGQEGLGSLSSYTEMWIEQVFPYFYNLARYSVSSKMMKIRNDGFKKLLKEEIENQSKEYVYLVNNLKSLYLAIKEIQRDCQNMDKNQEYNMECFDEYFNINMELTKLASYKMFKFGVGFGFELKNKPTENFKW